MCMSSMQSAELWHSMERVNANVSLSSVLAEQYIEGGHFLTHCKPALCAETMQCTLGRSFD